MLTKKSFCFVTGLILMVLLMGFMIAGCDTPQDAVQEEPEETEAVEETEAPAEELVDPIAGRPVEIVVPFGPGGSFDATCRLVAPYMQKYLEELTGTKQTVIVVNKPGAAGKVAYGEIYRHGPDTPSFVLMSISAIPQQVGMETDYDVTQFNYLGRAGTQYQGIFVHKDLPINTFDDLVARSQEQPVLFGTSGFGASEHQASLFLMNVLAEEGIDLAIDFVHYTGFGEIVAGLLKQEIEGGIDPVVDVHHAERSGDGRALAQIAPERTSILPDTPTLIEAGLPQNVSAKLESLTMFKQSFVGSPNMNPAIVDVLRKALQMALEDPNLLKQAEEADMIIGYVDYETDLQHSKDALEAMQPFKDLLEELFQ